MHIRTNVFSRKFKLVTLMKTPTGEKLYPCSQCEKVFTQKNPLNKHIETNTRENHFNVPIVEGSSHRKVTLLDM